MVQSQFFWGKLLLTVVAQASTDALPPPRCLTKLARTSPLALQPGWIREAIFQDIVLALGWRTLFSTHETGIS
jgi:hypothetical protein